MRPHNACRAAGLAHGIVRMTQSRRQVVRSKFLHQCADTAPGKPPFIAAAARVFVKVRQPFHVRPFWHGQDECAKQGTVDDIQLKAVRCQLPPNRYPRTHGAVSSPEILLYSISPFCMWNAKYKKPHGNTVRLALQAQGLPLSNNTLFRLHFQSEHLKAFFAPKFRVVVSVLPVWVRLWVK